MECLPWSRPRTLKNDMSGNLFIDLRNVYEPDVMRRAGFDYVSVGR